MAVPVPNALRLLRSVVRKLRATAIARAPERLVELGFQQRLQKLTNATAKTSFDRIEPVVQKVLGGFDFRLRRQMSRGIACHGVISTGASTPESLVASSRRLRRLQFPTTPATAPSALEISSLANTLLSSGKTVVLIMPLLNIGFDLPQRWIENQVQTGKAIDEWKVDADPSLTMSSFRAEIARDLHKYRDNPRLILVDPQSVACEHNQCYLVRNGQASFRDTAHISNPNALQYRGLFDAAFRSALQVGADKTPD